ncbi:MAG: hypothetical protein O2877_00870 [bacterium]|nr:hypothetical protein [bacterium]
MAEDFIFNIVSYAFIIVPIIVLVVMAILFLRDGVLQVPRFGVVLKYFGISLAAGILLLVINSLLPWAPFLVLGMALTGMPVVIILFVSGSFLHEASRADSGIALAVMGSFGAMLLGVFLRVVKYYL